jgi:radical SAM protein with 4Fe4S-binding SPASM domain
MAKQKSAHVRGHKSLQHITHDEFITSIAQHQRTRDHCPEKVTFELTFKCNLNCRHCYQPSYLRKKKDDKRELKYSEVCKIIDGLADSGVLWLCLTGGDVFCRPDFLKIYRHSVRKGLITTVFTNGTLIDERIIKTLKRYPPHLVEITFHSIRKGLFDGVTQVPNSFEKCMRGIRLLHENHIPFKLKTVVMNINVEGLGETREFAREMSPEYTFSTVLDPQIDGCPDPCRLRLSPKEVVGLDLMFEERRRAWKRDVRENRKIIDESDLSFPCSSGYNDVLIDPYGQLHLCLLSRDLGVDLKKHSFMEGVNRLRRVRHLKVRANKVCAKCNLMGLCGFCPLSAKFQTGRNQPTEYFCELGKTRFELFSSEGIIKTHGTEAGPQI